MFPEGAPLDVINETYRAEIHVFLPFSLHYRGFGYVRRFWSVRQRSFSGNICRSTDCGGELCRPEYVREKRVVV